MSDKTNEEKLRILQERLTTIKQKQIAKQEARMEQSKPISPVFEEDLVSQENEISEKKEKGRNSFWKITFVLIFILRYCQNTVGHRRFIRLYWPETQPLA